MKTYIYSPAKFLLLISKLSSESIIITSIAHFLHSTFFFLKKNSYLTNINFKYISYILLFLFILTIPVGTLHDFSITQIPNLNLDTQKIFSLNFFSLSVLLLFPLLICFWLSGTEKITDFNLNIFDILIILFTISSLVASLNSLSYGASLIWFIKLGFGILIYLLFSRITLGKEILKVIIYALIFSIFFESFIAILQFLNKGFLNLLLDNNNLADPTRFQYIFDNTSSFRVTGTLNHPNFLSKYLAIILPVLISIYFSRFSINKFLILGSITAGLITTFLTLSRWGMITAFAGIATCLYLLFKFKSFRSTINRAFLIIGLILSVLLLTNFQILNRYLDPTIIDTNFNIRKNLINHALFIVKSSPLGIGGGNFKIYYEANEVNINYESPERIYDVHNFYLLYASEVGIVSLLIIFIFLICLVVLYSKKSSSLLEENKFLAIGLISSITVFYFGGIWEPWAFTDRVGALYWLEVGLLINILYKKSKQSTLF